MSKSALHGITKSLAIELASKKIRVNCVAPGFIKTEMTDDLAPETVAAWSKTIPLQRMGETSDVANVALFLASDMGSYISGQTIAVCGGMSR